MLKKVLPHSKEVIEFELGDVSDRGTYIGIKFPKSLPPRLRHQFQSFLERECGCSEKFLDTNFVGYNFTEDVKKVAQVINMAFEEFDKQLVQLNEKHKDALEIILGDSSSITGKTFPNKGYWYDIALSFAGEHRTVIEKIAQELNKNNVSLFYDKFKQNELWGKRLSKYFLKVYGPKTRFVVVFISKEYPVKDFTDFEFTIAREEAKTRKSEFILPVRIDDTPVIGLPSDVAYLDLNEVGVEGVVENVLMKLGLPSATIPPEPTSLVVTLGVTPEIIDEQTAELIKVSNPYIKVCDKLEQDLNQSLSRLDLQNLKFVEDERDGEALSVRICFTWNLKDGYPEFGDISPWDILEIKPFEEIYPK